MNSCTLYFDCIWKGIVVLSILGGLTGLGVYLRVFKHIYFFVKRKFSFLCFFQGYKEIDLYKNISTADKYHIGGGIYKRGDIMCFDQEILRKWEKERNTPKNIKLLVGKFIKIRNISDFNFPYLQKGEEKIFSKKLYDSFVKKGNLEKKDIQILAKYNSGK